MYPEINKFQICSNLQNWKHKNGSMGQVQVDSTFQNQKLKHGNGKKTLIKIIKSPFYKDGTEN